MARTLALLAAPLAARAVSCPAGPDEAPRTALTVSFPRYSCETVRNEFKARMAMDPSYRVTAEASDQLAAARTTDATHDLFAFSYEATVQDQRQGSPRERVAGCVVSACGVKLNQGDEEGELYCSMRDLYCGAREDCVPLLDFGEYTEYIKERSRSRTDAGRCVGGAQPAFDGSVHRYNDQRGVSGNYGQTMKDAFYRTPAWEKEFWAPNTATIPNADRVIRNPYPYANAPPNPE